MPVGSKQPHVNTTLNPHYENEADQTSLPMPLIRLLTLFPSYIAIRDIQAGEEVTINYNGDANSKESVWFDVIESKAEAAPKSAKTKAVALPQKASRTKPDTPAAKSRKPTTVATKHAPKKNNKSKA